MRTFDVVFFIFQNKFFVVVFFETGAGDGFSEPPAKFDARWRGKSDEVEVVKPVAHGEDLATVDLKAFGHPFHWLSKAGVVLLEENLHFVFALLKFAGRSNLVHEEALERG